MFSALDNKSTCWMRKTSKELFRKPKYKKISCCDGAFTVISLIRKPKFLIFYWVFFFFFVWFCNAIDLTTERRLFFIVLFRVMLLPLFLLWLKRLGRKRWRRRGDSCRNWVQLNMTARTCSSEKRDVWLVVGGGSRGLQANVTPAAAARDQASIGLAAWYDGLVWSYQTFTTTFRVL